MGMVRNRHDYLSENHTKGGRPGFIGSLQKHQALPQNRQKRCMGVTVVAGIKTTEFIWY